MCTTVPLIATSAGGCKPAIAGLRVAYLTNYADITSFAVTSGKISGVVMSGVGLWQKWQPTADSTAYSKGNGTKPSKNSFFLEEETYLKYASITEEAIVAGNKLVDCCDLVLVKFYENGTTMFQGVQFNAAGTGIEKSKEPGTLKFSYDTAAGDDESKVEFVYEAKAKNAAIASASIITEAYITGL